MQHNLHEIASAIAVVNKHAKTAPNPAELYQLKSKALSKLLKSGQAKKMGLHYSRNPKNSKQVSDVLVQVDRFYFHLPSTKSDKEKLPHLGELNESYRNPPTHLSLTRAKNILIPFVGHEFPQNPTPKKSTWGSSTYLNNWQPPYARKKKTK